MDLPPAEFQRLVSELRHRGHSIRFTARGSSMMPFVRNGDVLTAVSADASTLRIGDIAFYRRPDGSLVAHRVLARSRRRGATPLICTRGDSRWLATESVSDDQVLGRIVRIERAGRVIRPGHPAWRAASLLWAASQPFGSRLLRIAHRLGLRSRHSASGGGSG
jgi:hypothetical protein